MECSLRLKGRVVDTFDDGLVAQDTNDGLTKIRDKLAFIECNFLIGDNINIFIKKITDSEIYHRIIKHPTKTWYSEKQLKWIGVINSKEGGTIDLKELKENESPFRSVFIIDERGWLSNDKYFRDFPVQQGDVIIIELTSKV